MVLTPRSALLAVVRQPVRVLFLLLALTALALTLPAPTCTAGAHITRTAARLFLRLAASPHGHGREGTAHAGVRGRGQPRKLPRRSRSARGDAGALCVRHQEGDDQGAAGRISAAASGRGIRRTRGSAPRRERCAPAFQARSERRGTGVLSGRHVHPQAGRAALPCRRIRRRRAQRLAGGAGGSRYPAILPDGRLLPRPGKICVEMLACLPAPRDGETDAAIGCARLPRAHRCGPRRTGLQAGRPCTAPLQDLPAKALRQ